MVRKLVVLLCTTLLIGASSLALAATTDETQEKKELPKREWRKPKGGICVALEREGNEFFRAYQSIVVTVYIGNCGDDDILITDMDEYTDNAFAIVDDRGETAPLTAFGKEVVKADEEGDVEVRELKPGEEMSYTFLLNRVYDMTLRRTYKVTLNRRIIKLDEDGKPVKTDGKYESMEVSSEPVEIVVK